jgi:parallel beta-helix repeat protein
MAQLYINEFLASNSYSAFDPDFGEFSDFLEIYNASPQAVNLKGYTITDKPLNIARWTFPDISIQAHQYMVLWADGRDKIPGDTAFCHYRNTTITVQSLHLSFSLSADGEYIGLYNSGQKLIDEIHFGVQERDVSYGRDPLKPEEWLFFSDVTAGYRNSDYGAKNLIYAPDVNFSLPGGFYSGQQFLLLESQVPGSEIRYTTDGSIPDQDSPLYQSPIEIFRNLNVRARVFQNGRLPGPITANSYFIDENIDVPIISITTDGDNLWGSDFGIFGNSIRGREVFANVEYFEKDGTAGFNTGSGIRIFGSTIYALPQKPISVRFRSRYGDSEINYPIFDERKNQKFTTFQLRNGGNDHNIAYFRDGLAVNLVKNKMDIDYQDYKPCLVYINGDYHGIYEIRERIDEQYIANNHHLSIGNIDLLEDSMIVVSGNSRAYQNLLRFVSENDLSEDVNYDFGGQKIDINSYTNYMIHKLFVGYGLYQFNNRFWRERNENGRWRWIANDLEHAFGQLGGDNYQENTIIKAAGMTDDFPEWSTILFSSLLKNTGFRDEFIQRFAAYLNTIYKPAETQAVVDSLVSVFMTLMPRHINKWNTPASMPVWLGNVNFIREFLGKRPEYVRGFISETFNVRDSAHITIRIIGEGQVYVAGVLFSDTLISGHFFKDTDMSLLSFPPADYRFVGWEGIDSNAPEALLRVSGDTMITVFFEKKNISIIPPVISSDTVLSAELSPWYGPANVEVEPGAILTIEAGAELLMSDDVSIYVYGGLSIAGNEANPVFIRPDPSPAARRPDFNTRPRWGVICAIDATDSIRLNYADISGTSYGFDRRKHFASISAFNSDVSIKNTWISDNMQPFYSEYGSVYIGFSAFRSENTCDLINVKYSANPIVEYCDLKGNHAVDTDAIDFDGVSGGVIRHNRIYGFYGSNSDGIDLGEDAKDVLIEYNIIFDCFDKGISVGQASTCVILRNVIFNCDMGIAVKDSNSFAIIDQNTLYSNNYSIACYEKNTDRGGGEAVVRNTILSGSHSAPLLLDDKSPILVRYSLSDTEFLSGIGNLRADPMFINPATGNFELHPSSPCINAGDPQSEPDPDQSRADIGAYYVHEGPSALSVHINELNYHPPWNYDTGEWIELYNRTMDPVDLSGWQIRSSSGIFRIFDNIVIDPGNYLVLSQDTALFRYFHNDVENVIGNFDFEMRRDRDNVTVMNDKNTLIHTFSYSNNWPWPPLAGGHGATIELEHGKDGNSFSDWRESHVLMGTPGAANSEPVDIRELYINELMATNRNTIADEYGEYDDWFELYNAGQTPVNIGGLYFTDNFARPTRWQAPLNYPEHTTILPGGFLLLWADGQSWQGPLHADFSLSASGEQLGIFQKKSGKFILMNGIIFGPQTSTRTYGRYPDGADVFSLMVPTPGYSNMLTSIAITEHMRFDVFPNPFSDLVNFKVEKISLPWKIVVSDIIGNTVWSAENIFDDIITMPGMKVNPGLYFYRIFDSNSKMISGKIIAF